MPHRLLRSSLAAEPRTLGVGVALLLLRVVAGAVFFLRHGWHKLDSGLAWFHERRPWPLLAEIEALHLPAPLVAACLATAVSVVAPLFLIAGFFTRLSALALSFVLAVAVLQNLLNARAPELALLYFAIALSLTCAGGGRFSLDAVLWSNRR